MVARFHDAGLEVILDVVYNHTAEGNERGPTLCFKGIDNASYYRLIPDQKRYYINDTGTGNTLNLSHPRVIQMVTDSLRYWVQEMHVDGFRFDLGTILAREPNGFDNQSGFLKACSQDPVLSRVKLIAEPWDCGPGGYQVGEFPPGWAEWNDQYRDTVRDFWRGEASAAKLSPRLYGSADIFDKFGRRPYASINFITAHDGFTLNDLVSYNERHNEANREDNKDGHEHNRSWNCGAEGPTDDEGINTLRARQMRNFLATLLLSQGTPMLLAGDEFARTQHGNNNAYCQDNEISWLDWSLVEKNQTLVRFVQQMTALRAKFPDSAAQPLPLGGRERTHRLEGDHLGQCVRQGDGAGAMERRRHAVLRHAARRPRPGNRPAPARPRRDNVDRAQCVPRPGGIHVAGRFAGCALVAVDRHQSSRSADRTQGELHHRRALWRDRPFTAGIQPGSNQRHRHRPRQDAAQETVTPDDTSFSTKSLPSAVAVGKLRAPYSSVDVPMSKIERYQVGPRMSGIVVHNGTVYLSGYVAETTAGQSVAAQTADILAQIDRALASVDSDKTRLLQATIWLADMSTFAEMNSVWDKWVSPGNTPVRACVEAKLALPKYTVEIRVIAAQH